MNKLVILLFLRTLSLAAHIWGSIAAAFSWMEFGRSPNQQDYLQVCSLHGFRFYLLRHLCIVPFNTGRMAHMPKNIAAVNMIIIVRLCCAMSEFWKKTFFYAVMCLMWGNIWRCL